MLCAKDIHGVCTIILLRRRSLSGNTFFFGYDLLACGPRPTVCTVSTYIYIYIYNVFVIEAGRRVRVLRH